LAVPDLVGVAGATVAPSPPTADAPVWVFGHPRGGPVQHVTGHVVAYVTDGALALDGGRVMTVDVPFEPGVSGGPVVDGDGRLVAIAVGVERRSGTGLAVPVDALTALLAGRGDPAPACR
jgi:S1-C subfamily serine protease